MIVKPPRSTHVTVRPTFAGTRRTRTGTHIATVTRTLKAAARAAPARPPCARPSRSRDSSIPSATQEIVTPTPYLPMPLLEHAPSSSRTRTSTASLAPRENGPAVAPRRLVHLAPQESSATLIGRNPSSLVASAPLGNSALLKPLPSAASVSLERSSLAVGRQVARYVPQESTSREVPRTTATIVPLAR